MGVGRIASLTSGVSAPHSSSFRYRGAVIHRRQRRVDTVGYRARPNLEVLDLASSKGTADFRAGPMSFAIIRGGCNDQPHPGKLGRGSQVSDRSHEVTAIRTIV